MCLVFMLFMFSVAYEGQRATYLFGYGKDLSWYLPCNRLPWDVTFFRKSCVSHMYWLWAHFWIYSQEKLEGIYSILHNVAHLMLVSWEIRGIFNALETRSFTCSHCHAAPLRKLTEALRAQPDMNCRAALGKQAWAHCSASLPEWRRGSIPY